MITAGFRAELDDRSWVADVSTAFPDATLRLLTGVPTDEGAIELGSVTAADPDAVVAAIDEHPATWRVERIGRADDVALVRYETANAGLYAFSVDAGLPPPFPLVVLDGRYEFEFTGTRADLDVVRGYLVSTDCAFELRFLRGSDDSDALVTDRQREVLEVARRLGYFAVPREASLAEVAAALDVDRSTASGIIRRGQARIVGWYLAGASGGR